MPKGDDIVPIRLKRHQYARMKLMIAVAKSLGYGKHDAGYQNTVVRGTRALEAELRDHCERTGQRFEDVVARISGGGRRGPEITGNLDDGDDFSIR